MLHMNLLHPTDDHTAKPTLDENSKHSERLRRVMRQPSVAADILVDIFSASTREKDGGQFHNAEGGMHPW
jgi:hypothetical protein